MRRRQLFVHRQQQSMQESARAAIQKYFDDQYDDMKARYEEEETETRHGREEVLIPVNGIVCPSCGKALARRGAHFHIRACKG